MKFLKSKTQLIAFDGEGDGSGSEGSGSGSEGSGGDGNDAEKQFTQEQVNTFVAEERRKMNVRQQKLASELEELKSTASLTKEEKEGLQQKIEELQTQYMTVEEKARQAADKASKKHSEELQTIVTERDTWKVKHEQLAISTEIAKTASEQKAISFEQIAALLAPKTKLTEQLDEEGKPTGSFIPKVMFPDKDKDDKPIILELTLPEAVKRMKELPQYGNLFEADKVGGLGGTGSVTSGKPLDIAKIAKDPVAYRKLRKEQPELLQ